MNIITANTCKTCKHSLNVERRLLCLRNPPLGQIAVIGGDPINGFQTTTISSLLPTQPDWSCGEYKPKIALEN